MKIQIDAHGLQVDPFLEAFVCNNVRFSVFSFGDGTEAVGVRLAHDPHASVDLSGTCQLTAYDHEGVSVRVQAHRGQIHEAVQEACDQLELALFERFFLSSELPGRSAAA